MAGTQASPLPSTVTVKIRKWSDYNDRPDVKRPSWLRLEWALVEDSDFYDFTHEEFKAWIYVLSMACKKNRATVRLNYAHAEGVARISRAGLDGAIRKLQTLGVVTVEPDEHGTDAVRARGADVPDAFTTGRDGTGRDGTGRDPAPETPLPPAVTFDFEALYRRYPLRKGKAAGLKECAKQVTTQDDYAALGRAIDAYHAEVKADGTPAQFQKHFSTFIGNKRNGYPWRDYLDADAGTSLVTGRIAGRAEERSRANTAAVEEYNRLLREGGQA